MEKINELFPEKQMKINSNDKPWIDTELKKLDRRRKRDYNKNKKSIKWAELNTKFLERAESLKQS